MRHGLAGDGPIIGRGWGLVKAVGRSTAHRRPFQSGAACPRDRDRRI